MASLAVTEWLFPLWDLFLSGVSAVLEFHYLSRFFGGKARLSQYPLAAILLCAVQMVALPGLPPLLPPLLDAALLFLLGRFLLKRTASVAAFGAILTLAAFYLCNGLLTPLLHSLAARVSARWPTAPGVTVFLLLAPLLALVFAGATCHFAAHILPSGWQLNSAYTAILLLPFLLILLFTQYMIHSGYGNTIILDEQRRLVSPRVNDAEIIVLLALAYGSLLAVLFACRKIAEGFSAQLRLALMEQETEARKTALAEARSRDEQTRAFRHDIRNHLTVLDGLLQRGEPEAARAYLGKLEESAAALSYPCRTENAVVDVLLGGKLHLAQQNGIAVECTVKLPSPCRIDDLDLCVVLANAADNAIKACEGVPGGFLRITGKQKGDFFLLEVENSLPKDGGFRKGSGIGLANIQAVADKYSGAVRTERTEKAFLLSVLFVNSGRLGDISEPLP